jgi:hypothetical protein
VQVQRQRVRVCKPNTPKDVTSHWVSKGSVVHHQQVEKVYSVDGVCVPIRTWGESLAGAGLLVWDYRAGGGVRSLVPIERWRIQGHSIEDWHLLGQAGISES